MRVISRKTLKDFAEKEPAAKAAPKAWYAESRKADWANAADVKATYASASILKNGRIVFNICGNTYRLVAWINYRYRTIYIRFVGTHKEYDKIDAERV
ncbi:MAG: type II toxin-antitoxin system HigB family toxin [Candidatus Hydrogenedentes bacterium]|nr:type II toxin-antitoxin system HigB family toxin [Candidatus Hydrogenedentota bacterium]